MSHGDQLSSLPPNFNTIASTATSPYTAIAHESKPIFGVQFHPEVSHSPKGKEVIASFVKNICGVRGGWSMVSWNRSDLPRRRLGILDIVCIS